MAKEADAVPPGGRSFLKEKYDVAIIGFGLAGAVAAVESLRNGAKTVVLETAEQPSAGGTSLVSGQGFIGAEDVDAFRRYLKALRIHMKEDLSWSESMSAVPEQLRTMGVTLSQRGQGGDFPNAPGAESVFRWRADDSHGIPTVRTVQEHALKLGLTVRYGSRPTDLRRDTWRSIRINYEQRGRRRSLVSQHGLVIATGGYAASALAPARATHGSPYADGAGMSLAGHLGATIDFNTSMAGPYYAFRLPGTRIALTPWPLYGSHEPEASGYSQILSPRGAAILSPPARWHGLERSPRGGYRRARLIPAALVVDEEVLSNGALVRQWPDGHAMGWGRRTTDMWSESNEREIARGWIRPLSRSAARTLGLGVKSDMFVLDVEASLLNTLGGLRSDSSFALLGTRGPIEGLYGAGEVVSRFCGAYQGSANLTECVVSGRGAVLDALGRK